MAYLDDPDSPWERMEARRERKKLAKLARFLKEHGFPAAARSLNCSFTSNILAGAAAEPLSHRIQICLALSPHAHEAAKSGKVSLLPGAHFCIA